MNGSRSLILDVSVRAVFHTVLLVALFFLFSGHNAPGGGFVAGLVAGAAFVLHDVATGFDPQRRGGPANPETIVALGLIVAVATGLASMLAGGEFLESGTLSVHLPVFDTVKATSALAFDVGVFLVVLGVVLTIVEHLGEEPEE